MIFYSKVRFLTGLLFFVVFLNTCSTENKPIYTLTTDVSPAEAGVVTQSMTEAEEGESIQVTATPNEHWVFTGWGGDLAGTDQSTVNVFMDGDRHITAIFEKKEYPLSVEIEGEGTVTEEIIQAKTTDYPHGTLVKLTAVPEFGWEFVRWTGDSESEDEEIEILIGGETNIKAVFQLMDFDLTIEIEGNGSVEEKVIQAKTTEYPFGTMVELSAIPEYGWKFVEWQGDIDDKESAVVQLLVDGDLNVKAIFERVDFTITLAIEGEGTVEQEIVQGKSTEYTFETEVQLTAIPETGWEFVEWRGDVQGSDQQIIITVDEDKDIEAVFKRQDFQLTIQVNGQGTVNQQVTSQAKTQSYTYLTEVQLTATPDNGWTFSSWSGDASGSQHVILVSMDSDKQIHANFENITHQLSIQVNGQGSVNQQASQGGQGTYPFETEVQLTAVPANGWAFAGWSGDVVSSSNPITVVMTQNRTVTVNFLPVPAQKRILPLGDSITNGFPYTYRYSLHNSLVNAGYSFHFVGTKNTNPAGYPGNWDTRHEGHNGAKTSGINQQLNNWLANYTADIALIHIGTNDILESENVTFNLETSMSNIDSIVKKLRADNKVIRIYLAKITPVGEEAGESASTYNNRITQLNNAIQNYVNTRRTAVSPLYVVDMNSGITDADLDDGIHPTEAGANKMAQRWFNAIINN